MAKKKTKKTKSTITKKSVMSRLELKQIRCTQSQTNLNIRIGPLPKKTNISVSGSLDIAKEQRAIKGNVNCEITSFYEGSDDPAISVQCNYQVIYGCITKSFPSKKILEEEAESIQAATTFTAWPFIRQYVHWMTSQMGVPPLPLPLIFLDMEKQRVVFKKE